MFRLAASSPRENARLPFGASSTGEWRRSKLPVEQGWDFSAEEHSLSSTNPRSNCSMSKVTHTNVVSPDTKAHYGVYAPLSSRDPLSS